MQLQQSDTTERLNNNKQQSQPEGDHSLQRRALGNASTSCTLFINLVPCLLAFPLCFVPLRAVTKLKMASGWRMGSQTLLLPPSFTSQENGKRISCLICVQPPPNHSKSSPPQVPPAPQHKPASDIIAPLNMGQLSFPRRQRFPQLAHSDSPSASSVGNWMEQWSASCAQGVAPYSPATWLLILNFPPKQSSG